MALLPRTDDQLIPPPAPLPKYLAHRSYTGEGRSLKLKRVLLDHNLTIAALARVITQHNGTTFSRPSMQQMVTYGIMPVLTPLDSIRAQTDAWLREHGVPEDQIATAFHVEDGVVELHAHPNRVTDAAAKHFGDAAALMRQHGVPENLIRESLRDAHVPVRAPRARPAKESTLPDIDPLEKVMLTPEAKKHFDLARDPFAGDPQSVAEVYLGRDHAYCRDAMFTCLQDNGFVAVIGESGSGKTVLRHDLLDRVRTLDSHVIVIQPEIIDKGRLTAEGLGTAIIKDIDPNAVVPQRLEAQARKFGQMLTASAKAGNRHLLIIEEAHDLTKPMLKQLKRFHELRDGFRKLLGILLIGQPEMKDKLNEATNWDAREVIRRIQIAELQPLHGTAIKEYIEHRLKTAGVEFKRLFDADAIDAIRSRLTRYDNQKRLESQLYPLVLNNLITRAANECAALGMPRINADIIKPLGVRK